MDKVISKLKEERGQVTIITIGIAAMLLFFGFFIVDYLRVYSMQENITDQLYRTTNLAVKGAMVDNVRKSGSYVATGVITFSGEDAKKYFKEYIVDDLEVRPSGVNGYVKHSTSGRTMYSIENVSLTVTGGAERPKLTVTANINCPTAFMNGVFNYSFPISVSSRNMRTDDYL